MPCLRSLNLSIPETESPQPIAVDPGLVRELFSILSQPSTSEDIVSLSNLTFFHYVGHPIYLSALLAGFSAPSLRNVDFSFSDSILSPSAHLPRFITEMEEHYYIAQVNIANNTTFLNCHGISLSLLTHSESTGHSKPRFKLHDSGRFPASIMQMNSALSTRLTIIEELLVFFDWSTGALDSWTILRHFSSVRGLRLEGSTYHYMAGTLHQGHEDHNHPVLLPALEEIQLGKNFH
jgi:hypothetical protein